MSYLQCFGMSTPPFSKEIADSDLWLPSSKQEVVSEMLEAIAARETGVLLVGEPGVGKTCVLRVLRHRLPQEGHRLTYCHNATLGRRDFYRQLCLALGLSPKATAAAVFYSVSTHVQELGRERIHPVFLLDEAHLLHQDTLDHLHILTNYEWDSQALLTLVLVGLPELRDRLMLNKNRSLWSRIHCRLSLGGALPQDTAEYLGYRVRNAGCDRDLFSSDAIALLHEASAGRLRELDRLATQALRTAASRNIRLIDRGIMTDVLGQGAR